MIHSAAIEIFNRHNATMNPFSWRFESFYFIVSGFFAIFFRAPILCLCMHFFCSFVDLVVSSHFAFTLVFVVAPLEHLCLPPITFSTYVHRHAHVSRTSSIYAFFSLSRHTHTRVGCFRFADFHFILCLMYLYV